MKSQKWFRRRQKRWLTPKAKKKAKENHQARFPYAYRKTDERCGCGGFLFVMIDCNNCNGVGKFIHEDKICDCGESNCPQCNDTELNNYYRYESLCECLYCPPDGGEHTGVEYPYAADCY